MTVHCMYQKLKIRSLAFFARQYLGKTLSCISKMKTRF
jgi:hypothetical protein